MHASYDAARAFLASLDTTQVAVTADPATAATAAVAAVDVSGTRPALDRRTALLARLHLASVADEGV